MTSANLSNLDAIIYLRKSRKDMEEEKRQAELGNDYDTLERHRKQLIEFAKLKNMNIIDILPEVVSGEFISERPKMQKLLRDVENGLVDAVLCMDLDRLGRGDMVDQGIIYRIFKNSETLIVTPTEIINPVDENQELTFSIKSLIAREELKSIVKRMQRGRRQSAREGKSITRKPPYGYLRDENLKLYPDPDTSEAVKMIFEMCAEGKGRRTVAEELDKMNIKPAEKEFWDPTMISEMIKNEVYIGKIIWGKLKYVKINGKYTRKKMPKENWIIHENAHEPIVSIELFERANTALHSRWRPHTISTKKLINPLAGLLFCEVCGKALVMQPRPNRPDNQLRCFSNSCKGVQKGINFSLVEEKILLSLSNIIDQFTVPTVIKKRSKEEIITKQKALISLNKEKLEIEQQKSNIHDLLEKGIYNIETFIERQNIVKKNSQDIQNKINQIQLDIIREQKQNEVLNNFIPQLRTVLDAYYETNDIRKKNILLKKVIEKATYLRKKEWTSQEQFELKLYTKI